MCHRRDATSARFGGTANFSDCCVGAGVHVPVGNDLFRVPLGEAVSAGGAHHGGATSSAPELLLTIAGEAIREERRATKGQVLDRICDHTDRERGADDQEGCSHKIPSASAHFGHPPDDRRRSNRCGRGVARWIPSGVLSETTSAGAATAAVPLRDECAIQFRTAAGNKSRSRDARKTMTSPVPRRRLAHDGARTSFRFGLSLSHIDLDNDLVQVTGPRELAHVTNRSGSGQSRV